MTKAQRHLLTLFGVVIYKTKNSAYVCLRLRKRRDTSVTLHIAGPGVVGRQGMLQTAEPVKLLFQVANATVYVLGGIGRVHPKRAGCARHKLHQTLSSNS